MINMTSWKELEVDVINDVCLDPLNVRLGLGQDAPEVDIIADLFHNEAAFDLAESIAKVGFLTHEVPIVVKRDADLVVVEGNRRLAALKAIQNPLLVQGYESRMNGLAKNLIGRTELKRITVKLAPSQDEANQLIAALHTGDQRRKWSPDRQASFFEAQIEAGKTLEQLIGQYPTIDVRKYVVRSDLLRLFRNASYSNPDLRDYMRRPNRAVATLERLYNNPKFRAIADLAINEETGRLEGGLGPEAFGRLAEKIIDDILAKRINTRILNKPGSEEFQGYLNEVNACVAIPGNQLMDVTSARLREVTDGDSTDGLKLSIGVAKDTGTTVGTETPFNAKSPPSSHLLNTFGILVDDAYSPTISRIFDELKKLNVDTYPNATLDLLRSFLEKTIKAYAGRKNEVIPSGGRSQWVMLADCLTWIKAEMKKSDMTKGLVQAINGLEQPKVGHADLYASSSDMLNAINHNDRVFASPQDVRLAWDKMKDLLKELLKP